MRCWAVFCALLVWSSAAFPALHEDEVDVLDRPVAPLLARGRPVMVLYANRATRGIVQGPATDMALRLHDVPFVTLVHIDLRGVPSLFRGMARRTIRRSQEEGVQNYMRAFRDAGLQPPTDSADRLLLVADNDGAPHRALGLPEGFTEAYAIVFDAQGNEVARGPFPRDSDRIEQALRDAGRGHLP